MAKLKRKKRRWGDWLPVQMLVYVFLRLAVWLAHGIPEPLLPGAGRMLGWLIQVGVRKQYRIATLNLERSRGIVEPQEIPAFLDRVYANLGSHVVAILRAPGAVADGTLCDGVRVQREELFDEARAKGNGLIVVVGHLGNYELAAVAIGAKGHPVNALARTIPNPFVDRYVTDIRTRTGCKIIPSGHGVKTVAEMLAALKRNEILAIEIDMDAKDAGILVDFCGQPAAMFDVPATLAIRRSAPIMLIECFHEEGVEIVNLLDPIDVEKYRDLPNGVEELTHEIARQFDASVRRHADQWLWLLDRWRGARRRTQRQLAEAGGSE